MKVIFLESAIFELNNAIKYYESEQSGLGEQFRSKVLGSLNRIIEFPTAYQSLSPRTRRCLIVKFPYAIIYRHSKKNSEILVVAIAHLHRKPDYWLARKT